MKFSSVFIFSCFLLFISQAGVAQHSGVGVGAILGDPTGITIKSWIDDNLAVDGALSFSVGENVSTLYLHSDLIYHGSSPNQQIEMHQGTLRTYYGGGLRLLFSDIDDETNVALRAPLGLNYSFNSRPAEAFFELVPTIRINPTLHFGFAGAIGARYYLNDF